MLLIKVKNQSKLAVAVCATINRAAEAVDREDNKRPTPWWARMIRIIRQVLLPPVDPQLDMAIAFGFAAGIALGFWLYNKKP